jgi:hypothetical protein
MVEKLEIFDNRLLQTSMEEINPFQNVSVDPVNYPRWQPLLKMPFFPLSIIQIFPIFQPSWMGNKITRHNFEEDHTSSIIYIFFPIWHNATRKEEHNLNKLMDDTRWQPLLKMPFFPLSIISNF